MREKIIFILLGFLFMASGVLAETHVISNSENWEDVYSSMLFAGLNGDQGDFLASTQHGHVLLSGIPTSNDIVILSSSEAPFVSNYGASVVSRNYNSVKEMAYNNFNLELINNLPDITDFIIVDGHEGYNALSVAPYAIESGSWVFISNDYTNKEIERILRTRNVEEVIFYGDVSEDLKNNLEGYYPQTIDNNNKYFDNLEILGRYLGKKPSKQVLMTGGDFIERELMSGSHPILFIGEDMPEESFEILQNSDIEIGVLIGNELINTATSIRQKAGISVMVKFADGARSQTAGVSAVKGLDLFYFGDKMLEYHEEVECSAGYEQCDEGIRYSCINNVWKFEETCNNECVEQAATYTYCNDSVVDLFLEGVSMTPTIQDKYCDGCLLEDSCVVFGYRNNGEYCDLGNDFAMQKNGDRTCDNSFECRGNICASRKCANEGLIERILSWFGNLFV